jgi:hypothetical protein
MREGIGGTNEERRETRKDIDAGKTEGDTITKDGKAAITPGTVTFGLDCFYW